MATASKTLTERKPARATITEHGVAVYSGIEAFKRNGTAKGIVALLETAPAESISQWGREILHQAHMDALLSSAQATHEKAERIHRETQAWLAKASNGPRLAAQAKIFSRRV